MIEYIVAVVSEFALKFKLTDTQAYRYLKFHKGINYIEENYNILHTLSFDEAVENVALFCRKCGGNYEIISRIVCPHREKLYNFIYQRHHIPIFLRNRGSIIILGNIMNKEFNDLKEGLTTDLIQFIINDYGKDCQSAMNILYESDTFSKISNPATGLYFQSSPYVYTYLQKELETGKIS